MIERATKESSAVKNIVHRPEGVKTGIIIDGGGMACVYGAGVVCGLEKLGTNFDVAIGCSAGSCDLAYFLAGQSELGTSIYYEDLTDSRFISWVRPSKFMDVDYLDSVFRNVKPLNTSRMRQNFTELWSAVVNSKTGQGEFLNLKDDSIDAVTAIRAAIAVPIAYNRYIELNGKTYCDGGSISLPQAIDLAINQFDCTDLLVILNRPYGSRLRSKPAVYELLMSLLYLERTNPDLRKALLARFMPYKNTLDRLWGKSKTQSNEGVNTAVIYPDELSVKFYTKNAKKLKEAAQQGREQVLEAFSI